MNSVKYSTDHANDSSQIVGVNGYQRWPLASPFSRAPLVLILSIQANSRRKQKPLQSLPFAC